MEAFSDFVLQYGYAVLAIWVFLDQLGVPIPAIPVLIAVGGLAGSGEFDLTTSLVVSTLASLPSDVIWYYTGRKRGGAVLRTLCRISLEPDSCVRTTENTFEKHGTRSLLIAKFIPGYQTLAPPLAGMAKVPFARFLAYSAIGAVLWSAVFLGVGYALHNQLDYAFGLVSEFGTGFAILIGGSLVGYVAWKFAMRQIFLRQLRIARISPSELKGMLDEGHEVAIVDLRHAFEIELAPYAIPGAQVMSLEEIDEHHERIPRDKDIVLYCT
jgi:membrane protein DedA with SNARE-associated domain